MAVPPRKRGPLSWVRSRNGQWIGIHDLKNGLEPWPKPDNIKWGLHVTYIYIYIIYIYIFHKASKAG